VNSRSNDDLPRRLPKLFKASIPGLKSPLFIAVIASLCWLDNVSCLILSFLLKNLKTGRVPYLGLELTMHVLKSQNHLVRQSFKYFFFSYAQQFGEFLSEVTARAVQYWFSKNFCQSFHKEYI
jgi:hypothetical protein